MCSVFLPVLAAAAFFSPVDVGSLPPVDESSSVVDEVVSDSVVPDDSSEAPLSSVTVEVENVDEIADAIASRSDEVSFASAPPVSGSALDELSFFETRGIRFYIPANYLDYVKLIDSSPYVLNTSSSSITLWTSNDSEDYRLAPMGGLQKRVYSSGYSSWQDVSISSKPESNLSSLSRSDVICLIL